MSIETGGYIPPEAPQGVENAAEKKINLGEICKENLLKKLDEQRAGISLDLVKGFYQPEFNLVSGSRSGGEYRTQVYNRSQSDQERLHGASFFRAGESIGVRAKNRNSQELIYINERVGDVLSGLDKVLADPKPDVAENRFHVFSNYPNVPRHPNNIDIAFHSKLLDCALGIDRENPTVRKEGDMRTTNAYSTSVPGLTLIHRQDQMNDRAHAHEIAYFQYTPESSQEE
jgi:hypothetical protein